MALVIENKYLAVLNYVLFEDTDRPLANYSLLSFEEETWQYEELKAKTTGKGIEVGEYGDPGDGTICVWDNGDLKLTAYISTRGELYQVGAYDGEQSYGKTNLEQMWHPKDPETKGIDALKEFFAGEAEVYDPDMKEWTLVDDWTCADIAKDAWMNIHYTKTCPKCDGKGCLDWPIGEESCEVCNETGRVLK